MHAGKENKTKVAKGYNVVWDEVFGFDVQGSGEGQEDLCVTVMDHDMLSKSDLVGEVSVVRGI